VRLPAFLEGLPRTAWLFAIPAVAFLVTIGIVVATSGGDNDPDKIAAVPTVRLTGNNLDVAPTTAATRSPVATIAPTAEPNRESCSQIQGTDYQSGTEREWYLANCSGTTPNTASGGGSTGGGGGAPAGGGGGGGYAVESGLGARLVVPAAGINAPVTQTSVGASGAMPDPVGYDNAVLYNFPSHPGLGGLNKVLAGHVDCGRCRNGGPGQAVFYNARNLAVGATAQWINSDGSVQNYVVTSSYAISAQTNFSSIVASGSADMTIITCTGTFSGGEYNNRHVVTFRLQ
jgi:sortase (surface protein transpeptidase)